ncbi:unnamed protein product [Prorocentrum cordatum]|uniref:HMG box domain-containing protein n=1 Tax=Prorocentrum cordatum TaxID=2364126 RepID=A0ABN9T890_9DINO|nr:unnamed protein product [Polarella glacialis]
MSAKVSSSAALNSNCVSRSAGANLYMAAIRESSLTLHGCPSRSVNSSYWRFLISQSSRACPSLSMLSTLSGFCTLPRITTRRIADVGSYSAWRRRQASSPWCCPAFLTTLLALCVVNDTRYVYRLAAFASKSTMPSPKASMKFTLSPSPSFVIFFRWDAAHFRAAVKSGPNFADMKHTTLCAHSWNSLSSFPENFPGCPTPFASMISFPPRFATRRANSRDRGLRLAAGVGELRRELLHLLPESQPLREQGGKGNAVDRTELPRIMALRVASALAGLALAEALAGQQAQELDKRGHRGARAERADASRATRRPTGVGPATA